MPYLCQIYGCNDAGTCDTGTGQCTCDGDGVHNYACTDTGTTGCE